VAALLPVEKSREGDLLAEGKEGKVTANKRATQRHRRLFWPCLKEDKSALLP
jgi:hypothetical protein